MNIVLDTSIIIRYPEILSIEKQEINFHVLRQVVSQLERLNPNLAKVLENIQNKSIKFQDFIFTPTSINTDDMVKVGLEDYFIMEVTKSLKSKYNDVKVATLDLHFDEVLNANGIETLNLNELKEIVNKGQKQEEPQTAKKIKKYKKSERTLMLQGVFIGISVSILISVVYNNLDLIINTIHVWGTIILAVLCGIGLFLFRERYRYSYGIAELSIGFIAVISIFYPDFDYKSIEVDIVLGLRLFGSLYIMVRGQDNILKSLEGTSTAEQFKQKIRRKISR